MNRRAIIGGLVVLALVVAVVTLWPRILLRGINRRHPGTLDGWTPADLKASLSLWEALGVYLIGAQVVPADQDQEGPQDAPVLDPFGEPLAG